ncbi:methylenetetrahydrofolate reductase, partial [Azospirillum brasilense]
LVALRGDPPETEGGVGGRYVPHPGGYAYAADLVAGMKKVADFEISVAAYPEAHPEAPSAQFDLDNLKRKVDAGATRAITQFFFDNDAYFRFLDRCAAAGITVPIVPGILPITNFARAVEFAGKCGAAMPQRFAETFEGLDSDPETRQLVAATMAAEQCQALQAQGIKEFHFYTLNRSDLTMAICRMLGVKARQPAVS